MQYPRISARYAFKLLSPDRLAMYHLCRKKATERIWRNGKFVAEYDITRNLTICEDFLYEDWAEMAYRDFIDTYTAGLMELHGQPGIILFYEDPELTMHNLNGP